MSKSAQKIKTKQHDSPSPGGAGAGDATRERIISAAEHVLRTKGYAGMTTLEVAQAAGISKRDLYARFANKDAMIAAMVTSGVREMLVPVALEPLMSRAAFYGALAAFGTKFLGDMLAPARLQFYRLAIAEAHQNPAIAQAILQQGTRATAEAVGAYFGEAQARGFVKFQALDAAVGAFFFSLMGDLMVTCLLDPTRVMAPEDIARQVGLAMMVVSALDGMTRA